MGLKENVCNGLGGHRWLGLCRKHATWLVCWNSLKQSKSIGSKYLKQNNPAVSISTQKSRGHVQTGKVFLTGIAKPRYFVHLTMYLSDASLLILWMYNIWNFFASIQNRVSTVFWSRPNPHLRRHVWWNSLMLHVRQRFRLCLDVARVDTS